MKRAAVLCLLVLAAAPVRAEGLGDQLHLRGNELYREGKFSEAALSYRQALEAGLRSPAVYYNLGNAELRGNRLGPAIAAYLKAERLSPRDADVAFNLAYARGMIHARLPELPRGIVSRALLAVLLFLSANEWTAIAIAAYWLAALAGTVHLYTRGRARRPAGWLAAALVAVFAVCAPFAAVRVERDYFTPRAVVVEAKVPARSGPGEDNAVLFDLYEGLDVEVGQCENSFCRVTTGGFIGWVPVKAIEEL